MSVNSFVNYLREKEQMKPSPRTRAVVRVCSCAIVANQCDESPAFHRSWYFA